MRWGKTCQVLQRQVLQLGVAASMEVTSRPPRTSVVARGVVRVEVHHPAAADRVAVVVRRVVVAGRVAVVPHLGFYIRLSLQHSSTTLYQVHHHI
jgi:hypothetical protein